MTLIATKTLYEQDFALWIEETTRALKSGHLSQVDWENLIEEVESLGIRERNAVESFLVRLLEHLLKRCYVVLPDGYRGWEIEIRNFRRELKRRLKYSPSLQRFMAEIRVDCYQEALEGVQEDYPQANLSPRCPFPLDIEILLTQKFWE